MFGTAKQAVLPSPSPYCLKEEGWYFHLIAGKKGSEKGDNLPKSHGQQEKEPKIGDLLTSALGFPLSATLSVSMEARRALGGQIWGRSSLDFPMLQFPCL